MRKIIRYYWTEDGKKKFAVYSDGTEEVVAEYDEYGNYAYRDERGWVSEGVEIIANKDDKLKWWQQYDPEKAEEARMSWNQWMPKSVIGNHTDLYGQLNNTQSNLFTPKALQTPVLGGEMPWQQQIFQYNPYDGPDYNRDARMRAELSKQEENEKNGIFKEEYRWNIDSRTINYLKGSGWENEVNKFSSERKGYTFNLLGGDIKIVRYKDRDGEIIYAPFVSPGFEDEGIIDITNISISTPTNFLYEQLRQIIYGVSDNRFLLEEIEGGNLIVKVDFKEKPRTFLAGRRPRVPLKPNTLNAVYAKLRNGKPYAGSTKDIIKRYPKYEINESNLELIHNLAKYDNKLLRAIERRMYEYLKTERGLDIDNRRKPMNDKDYALYFKKVQEVLKNSNWKRDLDKMFPKTKY